MTRVGMREYLGAEPVQQQVLIPEIPALYVWVFDFEELLGRPVDHVRTAISHFLEHTGREQWTNKDPFLMNKWHSARPPMPPHREDVVVSNLSESTELGRSMAHLCTRTQRPFYCGMTMDLSRRIGEHVHGDSPLLGRLGRIRVTDCAILWAQVEAAPEPAEEIDVEEAERDVPLRPAVAAFESLLIRTAVPTLNDRTD